MFSIFESITLTYLIIMKKQKLNSIHLKINKISIANLTTIKGGDDTLGKNNDTPETHTCSQFPLCLTTVATRPDSLNPDNNDKGGQ